jgi:hypothetical protein
MVKIGCCNLSKTGSISNILILGGMNKYWVRSKKAWIFKSEDVTSPIDLPDMNIGRIFNPGSGVILIDKRSVMCIGGA